MIEPKKAARYLRKALGSTTLRVSDVRLVRALLMFTSLEQKRRCLRALDELERGSK